MFRFSIATTMMSVITTSLLMVILTLCLLNRKLLLEIGYKLLAIFVLFTTLRFALPFDFPFTMTIPLPSKLSSVIISFHSYLFYIGKYPISIWSAFEFVWLCGAVLGIIYLIFTYFIKRYDIVLCGKELTDTSPYKELVDRICKEQHKKNNFRVIEYPYTSSPALFGIIHPKILIPENVSWTEEDCYYILGHEMSHHFHHDLLLKCVIKLITLIYWWNLLGILLNHETDVILEMRVDNSLTHNNADRTSDYLHCLLEFAEHPPTKGKKLPSYLTMNLQLLNQSDFNKRYHLLLNNQKKHSVVLNIILFGAALILYIGSYSFVLEAYNTSSESIMSGISDDFDSLWVPTGNSTYLIDNGDGTYGVYVDGFFLENVDSIDYYPAGTPIYTPDTAPSFPDTDVPTDIPLTDIPVTDIPLSDMPPSDIPSISSP
mgnify:CR=1 FL=1